MNVLSIIRKTCIFTSALVVLFCISSCKQNTWKTIYFIPRGYKGWVNIVYTNTAKSVQPFRFNDGYVYMITGDPSDFKISYDQSLDKWHETNYYYYDKDSITNINNKIYLETTLGSPGNSTDVKQKINAYSFFISDETEFKKDPKNPIFERYK
jgi:hypothetical protein